MLNILEEYAKQSQYDFVRMDGSTVISARQALIERFNTVSRMWWTQLRQHESSLTLCINKCLTLYIFMGSQCSYVGTLRSAALALSYSAAEYCAPVCARSSHTNLVDTQLNSTMRIISGTIRSTPLLWLPVLSYIAPMYTTRSCDGYSVSEGAS